MIHIILANSVNRKILMDQWNNEVGKVNGTTPEIRDLNRYLDSIRYKIYKIQLIFAKIK